MLKEKSEPSRRSEHPTQGGKISKRLVRWDHRVQRQNIFMAFKRVPVTLGQQRNVREKTIVILYTYCTLIAMQENQKKTLTN